VSELLSAAFKALGMDADRREITLVANALRASGDAEVRALLGPWPPGGDGWDMLVSSRTRPARADWSRWTSRPRSRLRVPSPT
jgi:hypothetical protein